MFERATKKLGLDQAIFMGGDFQQTGCNIKNDDGTEDKKGTETTVEFIISKINFKFNINIFIFFKKKE